MRLSSGNRLFVLKPELSSYKEVKKKETYGFWMVLCMIFAPSYQRVSLKKIIKIKERKGNVTN